MFGYTAASLIARTGVSDSRASSSPMHSIVLGTCNATGM